METTFYEEARQRYEDKLIAAQEEYLKELEEAVTGEWGKWVDSEIESLRKLYNRDENLSVSSIISSERAAKDEKGQLIRSPEGHLELGGSIRRFEITLPTLKVVLNVEDKPD